MLSGKHCSNNKNNTAITALHQQWAQNKSQTHQPVSGLPPTHQMHTMPPHPLCLKQLRQRARKVIFKTLSQHLTSHCFPHFCTDPNVNSKHLRVICCGHRERKFLGWRSMSHEYLCVTTHWSIIDMWCWIKTIWCCGNPPPLLLCTSRWLNGSTQRVTTLLRGQLTPSGYNIKYSRRTFA